MFIRQFHFPRVISIVTIFAIAMPLQIARADTVSTSFENLGAGTISIGMSPFTATFTNGNAMTVGNPAFYRTGSWSWHVSQGVTGLITLETPASNVDLWVKETPGGAGEVRAIDTGGATIATLQVSGAFQNFLVTRTATETLIASVEYQNTGTADVVMDDFSFTADLPTGEPLDDPIPAAIPQGSVEIQDLRDQRSRLLLHVLEHLGGQEDTLACRTG